MTQLLKPGQRVADYEIQALIGMGGMGEVYRARQLSMDRWVALKILAPRLAAKDPSFARHFVAEARAAGRLNHVNIVAVHDVSQVEIEDADGRHVIDFFSMELVEGESVKDVLDRDGACPLPLIERVMLGMAEALIYAEQQRIIHRDIKPDNIMITKAGIIKLADLGLAVQAGSESVSDQRDQQGRARVMGTPLYMSPEQARALPLDTRSDQYCLGATLFHLLTGQAPYRGDDSNAIMRAHVFEPVPDPSALCPELPEMWCRLCRRLMAKTPQDRFANARDMKLGIEAVVAGNDAGIDSKPRAKIQLFRGRALWVWAALIVLAMGIYVFVGSRSNPASGLTRAQQKQAQAELDARLEAERLAEAAAESAVQEALAQLPLDPLDALVIIKRLQDDPANKKMLPQLQAAGATRQREAHARAQVIADDLTKRGNALLNQLQQALDEGKLAEARQRIPRRDLLPTDVIARWDSLSKRLEEMTALRRESMAHSIAQSGDEKLSLLVTEIGTSDLDEIDKEILYKKIDVRRAQIKETAEKTSQEQERLAWVALAELVDEQRGIHVDLATLAAANQFRFSAPRSLELLQALQDITPLTNKIERSLTALIDQRKCESSVIINGAMEPVRFIKINPTTITLQNVKGGEIREVERRSVVILTFHELIEKASAKVSWSKSKDAALAKAAYLWLVHDPEASVALINLGENPLVQALHMLDEAIPHLSVVAPVKRSGHQVTASYLFNAATRSLVQDFNAEHLSIHGEALRWLAVGGPDIQPPRDDASLATLRWLGSMRPPLEMVVTLRLTYEPATILIGFDAGTFRVRLGVRADFAQEPRAGMICTNKNGGFIYAGHDKTDWTLPADTRQVRVVVKVNERGEVTAQANDAPIESIPEAVFPIGINLTPIIQVLQKSSNQTTVDIFEFTVKGDLSSVR